MGSRAKPVFLLIFPLIWARAALGAGIHSEGTTPKNPFGGSKTFRAPPARGLVTALRVYML